jgi:hypothetical protein
MMHASIVIKIRSLISSSEYEMNGIIFATYHGSLVDHIYLNIDKHMHHLNRDRGSIIEHARGGMRGSRSSLHAP